MTHDDPTLFSAALRERVRDEDPDLDQLIQVSTRTGTRLRRRRTVGVSVAGVAAGVAVIGIVGAALGGSGGTPGSDPGFATQPTAAASTAPAVPKDVLPPTAPAVKVQDLPVHVVRSLKGWQIGTAADDKFPASKGDYFLGVVVRPMDQYASWSSGDSDRPASQVAHVGENYFVTVQPNPDVPQGVVAELTGALRYDARWAKGAH